MEIQMNDRYAKACVEVLEIMKFLGEEYINKVPKKIIEELEANKDKSYNYVMNPNVGIQDQNLSDETIGLLTVIELRYWCTNSEEREQLSQTLIKHEERCQQKQNKQYDMDEVFNKRKEKLKNDEVAMVEYREKFWIKIINKLKSIFRVRG